MCFETLLAPVCPTCLKQDGEPGYESTKCPEAKENWLGHGKCSQVPPVKRDAPPEEYLNAYECIPCSWETEKRKEAEEAEAERAAEEEIQRQEAERERVAAEQRRLWERNVIQAMLLERQIWQWRERQRQEREAFWREMYMEMNRANRRHSPRRGPGRSPGSSGI